jgi:hypothetical protein
MYLDCSAGISTSPLEYCCAISFETVEANLAESDLLGKRMIDRLSTGGARFASLEIWMKSWGRASNPTSPTGFPF